MQWVIYKIIIVIYNTGVSMKITLAQISINEDININLQKSLEL